MLAVVETHPIQYHAPVYRAVQAQFGVPVSVVYGSDFSVAGYRDAEFDATFAWDTDLLSGYASYFLGRARAPTSRGLRHLLGRLAPRALLLVGYSPRFHQVAWLAAMTLGCPVLFRAETTDHAVMRHGMKVWARDQALRLMYRRCSRLLYVGQRSYHHFKRLGCPDSKLVFSPYCVDGSAHAADESARHTLRDATRQALRIEPDTNVLLLAGKLVRRKRPDLVLNAVKMLTAEQRARVHVLVLGSGEEQFAFETLARDEPSVAVSCVGFQNQRRLSAYYHAADLLVLPSESGETWGLVVNEALHHGVPCVVSDAVGCAPDLIEPGYTGEVFASGSASSLAAALERAGRLVRRPNVRARCRLRASGYTVEKAAQGIAQAYAAVAHGA